jgi:hypothetical protein
VPLDRGWEGKWIQYSSDIPGSVESDFTRESTR